MRHGGADDGGCVRQALHILADLDGGQERQNCAAHKTLVRYDNKWWDAMGNEVK
ncbi:MAG: hypothetical protein IKP81_14645 [Paludibacteraceae bacterium]|nr:hypothetical protein [Paludibacteraceae bacterium]